MGQAPAPVAARLSRHPPSLSLLLRVKADDWRETREEADLEEEVGGGCSRGARSLKARHVKRLVASLPVPLSPTLLPAL